MSRGLKEEVKTVIHSLLVPHARGLPLKNLCQEYAESEMKQIPFRAMGYNDLLTFLMAIPDTVRVNRLQSGIVVVQAAVKEEVSHIQEFVQGQNNKKSGSVRRVNNLLRNSKVRVHCNPARQGSGRPVLGSGRSQHSQLHNHSSYKPMNYLFTGGTGGPVLDRELSQSDSLNYEAQLITDLIDLLKPFSGGVDNKYIGSMYKDKFNKPLRFDCIKKGMIDLEFYRKHEDKFNLQWIGGCFVVSLHSPNKFQKIEMQETYSRNQTSMSTEPSAVVQPAVVNNRREELTNLSNNLDENYANGQETSSGRTAIVMRTSHKNDALIKEQTEQQEIDVRSLEATLETAMISAELTQSAVSRTVSSGGYTSTSASTAKISSQRKIIPIAQLVSHPRKPRLLGGRGGALETFGVRKPDVPNVCTPDTVIPHEDFPNIPEDDFFFIIVAEVYSPGRFYWFLNQNRKAIEQLTDDLMLFYNLHDEYTCSLNEMYIGQIVAARYVDNLWYRAQVIGFRDGEFHLFYIDYGSSCSVPIGKIRHLPLHFTRMPVQAFRGELHGIMPVSADGQWSPESSRYFLNMIKGSKVVAACKMEEKNLMITDNDYEMSYSLVLVDTNSEVDINIAHRLVEQNLAEVYDDIAWDYDASKQETNVALPTQSASVIGATLAEEPSNRSLMTGEQLTCELQKRRTIISDKDSDVREQQPEIGDREALIESGSRIQIFKPMNSETPSTRRVKRIELNDGRIFFIIKEDGILYLTKFELLKLIPDIDLKMKASRMKLNLTPKELATNSDLFFQCQTEGAPWIQNCDNDIISMLELFPLKDAQTVLFLFKRDRVASAAFEAEIKDINDPYWEEPFVITK